jgi:hypothetical protein
LFEDELSGRLVVLDVADRVLEDGEFLAWTSWLPVLADGSLAKFDLAPVRVAVDVNVCDAHCCGGNVYIALLLFDSGACRRVFGLGTPGVFECSKDVNCGVGWGPLYIAQRFIVSLRCQGQIVIALLVLFGVRETWRRHVCSGCRWFNRDRGVVLIRWRASWTQIW